MREAGVEVLEASSADRGEWERFVAGHPGGERGHRWELLDALHDVFGQRGIRLVAKRGPTLVGVLPLVVQKSMVGRFATSVPYLNHAGILGLDSEARRALAEASSRMADQEGVDRLELRGRDGSDLPLPVWEGKYGYTMQLPPTEEALNEGLGAKLRSQIKRPRREGCGVAIENSRRGREAFYRLLACKWHELGSPVLPVSFFAAMETVFGSDLDYVVVRRSNVPVAAGVLLHGASRVEIPWAASDRAYDRISVNMLLYWGALARAIERGAREFDLGRSTPGSGNARFKLQWGATERPLRWNVRARGDRGRAAEPGGRGRSWVAAIWRRLPAAAARTLGPTLAARVPL